MFDNMTIPSTFVCVNGRGMAEMEQERNYCRNNGQLVVHKIKQEVVTWQKK